MKRKYKLPKEYAEELLSMLRSGDYEQVEGVLHEIDTDRFCCLGLAGKAAKVPLEILAKYNEQMLCSREFERYEGIPEAMRDYDLNRQLAEMNDEGKTFLEIADWVVENVEFV